ncbi:Uncharacterized protein dnl_52310 [Desulfonema limicola]|uniref:Uncharacterized protein n=1 Tax=Desulfonema limicola TaxID=45656 RepID=A0A975BCH6_9BACT|nr:Uncharacterized protein dnl_52310 [Desulfonema limicola]
MFSALLYIIKQSCARILFFRDLRLSRGFKNKKGRCITLPFAKLSFY